MTSAEIPHTELCGDLGRKSADILAEILHAAFCGDGGQNSACKVSAEILHAELCGDFGRKYAFIILQRFQPKNACGILQKLRPKFSTQSSPENAAEIPDAEISAKIFAEVWRQNSGEISAEFCIESIVPAISRIFLAELRSEWLQNCGCRISDELCFHATNHVKANRNCLGISTEVDLKLPPIYCRNAGTFCEEAAKL